MIRKETVKGVAAATGRRLRPKRASGGRSEAERSQEALYANTPEEPPPHGCVRPTSANQLRDLNAVSCPCCATFDLPPPAHCCMSVCPRHAIPENAVCKYWLVKCSLTAAPRRSPRRGRGFSGNTVTAAVPSVRPRKAPAGPLAQHFRVRLLL